jgi:transposase-like protein
VTSQDLIMKKRKTYSGSFKAKVVKELINGDKDVKTLAEAYRLHPNQIKNWKSLLLKRAPNVLEDRRRSKKGLSGGA